MPSFTVQPLCRPAGQQLLQRIWLFRIPHDCALLVIDVDMNLLRPTVLLECDLVFSPDLPAARVVLPVV